MLTYRKRNVVAMMGAIGVLAALTSCVERKETITISPDGSVAIRIEHRADSKNELEPGLMSPTGQSGWEISTSTERDAEGNEKHILIAEQTFAPRAALPSTYAVAGSVEAAIAPQFPTTLVIEKRDDGTYYHFRRTYSPRRWAFIDYEKERIEHDLGDLADTEPAEMSPSQRIALIKALAHFEALKQIAFAREAIAALHPDLPQDRWLAIRDAMVSVAGELDYNRLSELVSQNDNAALSRETESFENRVHGALISAARDALLERAIDLDAAYMKERKAYGVTERLGAHMFEITVRMPGEIVGSNADETEGSKVIWRFGGDAMRDREVELLVTSKVASD